MPSNVLRDKLLAMQGLFYPVVAFHSATEKLIEFDFTGANKEINAHIFTDTIAFCRYIDTMLLNADAMYGIGGYNEARLFYGRSKLFGSESSEPRRLHLGMDIWGAAGTTISAPLDGIVHSCANNDELGDYGATIILQHELDGLEFFTLYGHLSRAPLSKLRVGQKIKRGEVFTYTGLPSENGSWPPHLHFQIIDEIGAWKGDYPGVCRESEKDKWLANSPDPDYILDLKKFL